MTTKELPGWFRFARLLDAHARAAYPTESARAACAANIAGSAAAAETIHWLDLLGEEAEPWFADTFAGKRGPMPERLQEAVRSLARAQGDAS